MWGNLLSYVDFFLIQLPYWTNSVITKMYFKCVIFFCLMLLNRQTSSKMSIDFFLITYYFFSCLIALGKVFRKMLSSSICAYTWPFPWRILNIHYSVGCMPWFLADQVDSLYLLQQTAKLVKDFVAVIIAAVVITWLNQRIFWYNYLLRSCFNVHLQNI